MDIRTATKGTKPQKLVTEAAVPTVTDKTPTEELYDGDALVKEYMEFLKEHNISKDDVMRLLDAIITDGSVDWNATLFNGRVPISFTMRSGWVEDEVARRVDETSADAKGMSMPRFSNLLRMLNIAGSLTKLGERTFSLEKPEDFDAQYAFVQSLPYPLIAAIGTELAVFDRAVAVATSDWALRNFTAPQKESSQPGS